MHYIGKSAAISEIPCEHRQAETSSAVSAVFKVSYLRVNEKTKLKEIFKNNF